MAFAVGALLVSALVSLSLPLAARYIVDNLADQNLDALNQYFAAAIGIAALLAFTSALRFWLIARLGERVVADLRKAVFDSVITLSPAFYEKTMTGEVVSRITTDTTLIQSIVGASALAALRSFLTLGGGLIFLFLTSVKLAGIVVLVVPFVLLPIALLGRRLRAFSREVQEWIAASSGKATESLSAVQTVQSFSHEAASKSQFAWFVESSFESAGRRNLVSALLMMTVTFLAFVCIVVVLWVGISDVRDGTMSFGELIQFMIYAAMVATATTGISRLWGEVQRAAGATDRLVELLHAEDPVADRAQVVALPDPVQGRIAFENVRFTYPSRPADAALDGVSFTIEPGETVAVVGPSGAGKSTVIQLLQRFYDPVAGRITLDGVDLADLARPVFRRAIALVPQDPVIFAASAADNIRFGNPEASDAEIIAAARAAAAHDFIDALPQGYDSHLGERGVKLSGGQKQRVAIARAILRDAPVLLLDEATSALDAESEYAVQQAVEQLSHSRTTLIIAHRLATVKKADRIIVLNAGKVVATGTHDTLVAAGGLYARLARLQFTHGGAD